MRIHFTFVLSIKNILIIIILFILTSECKQLFFVPPETRRQKFTTKYRRPIVGPRRANNKSLLIILCDGTNEHKFKMCAFKTTAIINGRVNDLDTDSYERNKDPWTFPSLNNNTSGRHIMIAPRVTYSEMYNRKSSSNLVANK